MSCATKESRRVIPQALTWHGSWTWGLGTADHFGPGPGQCLHTPAGLGMDLCMELMRCRGEETQDVCLQLLRCLNFSAAAKLRKAKQCNAMHRITESCFCHYLSLAPSTSTGTFSKCLGSPLSETCDHKLDMYIAESGLISAVPISKFHGYHNRLLQHVVPSQRSTRSFFSLELLSLRFPTRFSCRKELLSRPGRWPRKPAALSCEARWSVLRHRDSGR